MRNLRPSRQGCVLERRSGITLIVMAVRASYSGKTTLLWAGAIVTALAAVFFPRVQGIRDRDESWWSLLWFFVPQDLEGLVLGPLVIVLTIGLFALVGRWAWTDTAGRNRPAKVGLVSSLLGIAGVVVFWLSGPIVLGGLGTTLGLEGRRRAEAEGSAGLAIAAIVFGLIAFAIGASVGCSAKSSGSSFIRPQRRLASPRLLTLDCPNGVEVVAAVVDRDGEEAPCGSRGRTPF
jgi:hypothetical protein